MENFDPGELAHVDVSSSQDRWTLVFVKDLRHPPTKVWAALTEPGQLTRWAPYTADRNLASPGEATLRMIDGDGDSGQHLPASVVCAGPPVLLEHTWGGDLLRWELTATSTGTRLTLLHTLDDRDWAPKVAAGWHLCLVVADRLLEGRPIDPIRGEDAKQFGWDELNRRYAEKLSNAERDHSDPAGH
ncbi:MAG TPA: SRPBCC family protein [Micromonosporaceae bacterium]